MMPPSTAVGAERSAFVQLALKLRQRRLAPRFARAVFIVTDSSRPVMPGLLCREYMFASAFTRPDETYVVCASAGLGEVSSPLTLADLHPYASCYARLDGSAQPALGARLSAALERPKGSAAVVYDAALQAAQCDTRDELHGVRYGAACRRGAAVHVAHQRKALEYGATLDPVALLATQLEALLNKNDTPSKVGGSTDDADGGLIWVAMVDQFGVAHAPFGAARAYLSEHGLGEARVVCHDDQGRLHVVQASALAPQPPAFNAGDLLLTKTPPSFSAAAASKTTQIVPSGDASPPRKQPTPFTDPPQPPMSPTAWHNVSPMSDADLDTSHHTRRALAMGFALATPRRRLPIKTTDDDEAPPKKTRAWSRRFWRD